MKRKLLSTWALCACALFAHSQRLSVTEEEDRALSEHYFEIASSANISSEDAYEELRLKYRCSTNDMEKLKFLLQRRELRKHTHNFLETSARNRVIQKMKIDSLFQDSIDAILIPYNHDISEPIISMALFMANPLKLQEKKQKLLLNSALDFARRKRKQPRIDLAVEEMKVLKIYLSRKELERVIDEKNALTARVRIFRIWDELAREGATENELDSVEQVALGFTYCKLEMRYRDLYVGDSEMLTRNLADLHAHRPAIIKMYEALTEKKRIKEEKEKKEKHVDMQYAW